MSNKVSGIVLAGGHSTRLGTDKRLLRLWGESGPTLLEHTVTTLAALCEEVVVVLNDPEQWTQLRALKSQLVPDMVVDLGPLGGLVSGLSAVTHEHALVVGADMPLLNSDLLRFMITYPRSYTALVPIVSSRPQPLHAIYHRSTKDIAHTLLGTDVRRMTDFLSAIAPTYLDTAAISAYDPQGLSFLNVNTPNDLIRIQNILRHDQ